MAVLIEGLNVIVRCETASRLYPDGVQGMARDCPNNTFCTDGSLARIGFMSIADARRFIANLEGYGLTYSVNGECMDIALASAEEGVEWNCRWFGIDQHPKGYFFGWMAGKDPGDVAAPSGHDLDDYERKIHYISNEDLKKYFEFLGEENGVREYLDRRNGQKLYIGRTTSLDAEIVENRVGILRKRIFELEAFIDQARRSKDVEGGGEIHSELLSITEEAERSADDKVPESLYLCGLVHRVQEHWGDAEKWFRRFAKRHPYHPSVWLELTWCLAMLDRKDDALVSAKRAHELAPNSPASLGNLAAAHMELGQLTEAKRFIHRAISIDPQDTKNQYLQSMIAKRLGNEEKIEISPF